MAEAFAIQTAEVTKKVTVVSSAFGSGMILGWVAKTRPEWATVSSLMLGAAGIVGSLMTKGMMGEISLGIGSAAMGALGASIPTLFTTGRRTQRQIQGGGNGTKLLTTPTNSVAEAIVANARSAVEF